MRRRFARTAAVTLTTVLLIGLWVTPAIAVGCDKSGTTLRVGAPAGAFSGETATIAVVAGEIRVNGVACSDGVLNGTTSNIDTIQVTGSAGTSETLQIDLSGGAFAPGATAEAVGTSEIEFTVDLDTGSDTIVILGGSGVDSITLGVDGIELNGDGPEGGGDVVDLRLVPAGNVESFRVDGQAGADTISAAGGLGTGGAFPFPATLVGGGGTAADTLTGGANTDTLSGGAGADNLTGGGEDDALDGGSDNDTLTGNTGNDTLTGGGEDDTLHGSDDSDVLNGDAGIDTLNGGNHTDALNGGAGVDALNGGSGEDILNGGAAVDTLNGEGDNDTLNGDDGNDTLNGDDGNDTLNGGEYNDKLSGGDGDDLLDGGPGPTESAPDADTIGGGPGANDRVDYSDRNATVSVTFDGVADDGQTGEGDNVGSDVEVALLPLRTLTVGKSGSGTGTVTSAPAGVNCGGDCEENYAFGTSVVLTATPAAGSTFTGWSGEGCSGTGTCTVTMDANRSVTASFASVPPPPPPPQGKSLSLKAQPKKVEKGKRTTLTATIASCTASTQGDVINFYRGTTKIGSKVADGACAAALKVKMKATATFSAVSPADSNSQAATSNAVKVKVRQG